MLVMAVPQLAVVDVATSQILFATWPDGFVAAPGPRITIRDPDGRVRMTQGVENPDVRARVEAGVVDVCGFGEKIYD
jgi:hypothetical protein